MIHELIPPAIADRLARRSRRTGNRPLAIALVRSLLHGSVGPVFCLVIGITALIR